jgi:hypothetical protein
MKLARTCTGLLVLGLLAGAAAGDETPVYKWVGEDGIPHYTDRPPAAAEVEQLDIRYRRTDRQAVQAQLARKAELAEAARTRETQEAEVAVTEQAERAEVARQRAANCEQAKSRLTRYDTAHRLYRPLPDGERDYLDAAELDAARADARKSVEEWCDD